jgi:hypothetical protein|tara:strand:- start:37 stop:138 length:102 start_codon:yes stop_codon:yes gene_type:complete
MIDKLRLTDEVLCGEDEKNAGKQMFDEVSHSLN